MRDFNVKARANPRGFRAQLATRFKIGDTQISAVLNNVEGPADAYMVFLLSEMSMHPADYVLDRYNRVWAKDGAFLPGVSALNPDQRNSTP
jgi:hypothetical protein